VLHATQISSRLQTALQRQIHYEYNKTASVFNTTGGSHDDDAIDHVTLTWDAMQTKVTVWKLFYLCRSRTYCFRNNFYKQGKRKALARDFWQRIAYGE